MINRFCENCGKKLDKTLICSACGTDYNEKPVCEHVFNSYMLNEDARNCYYKLYLKCEECDEIIELHVTRGMLRYFVSHESNI